MATHILNGDALLERFPQEIKGDIIVMRECLVDGDVSGDTLAQLFANRAAFIESYAQVPQGEYAKISLPEFDKIAQLSAKDRVICWFEEDLFCQINFWFIVWLLEQQGCRNIGFVRPSKGNEYSYATMNNEALIDGLTNCLTLSSYDQQLIAQFWPLYQQNNDDLLLKKSLALSDAMAFIVPAVKAQLARQPDEQGLGEPERALLRIMQQLGSDNFGPVFARFCQEQAIYSFGDLQVFRMFEWLKNNP